MNVNTTTSLATLEDRLRNAGRILSVKASVKSALFDLDSPSFLRGFQYSLYRRIADEWKIPVTRQEVNELIDEEIARFFAKAARDEDDLAELQQSRRNDEFNRGHYID